MKKLNNKGFAISTMLYGLLIIMILIMSLLMNTMAFTRKNSKEFVNNIVYTLEKRPLSIEMNKVIASHDPSKTYDKLYTGNNYNIDVIIEIKGATGKVEKVNDNTRELGMVSVSVGADQVVRVSIRSDNIYSTTTDGNNTFRININLGQLKSITAEQKLHLILYDGAFIDTGNQNLSEKVDIEVAPILQDKVNVELLKTASYPEYYAFNLRIYKTSGEEVTLDTSKKIKIPLGGNLNLLDSFFHQGTNLIKDTTCDKPNCYEFRSELPVNNGYRNLKDVVDNYGMGENLSGSENVVLQIPEDMFGDNSFQQIQTGFMFCSTIYNKNGCSKGYIYRK